MSECRKKTDIRSYKLLDTQISKCHILYMQTTITKINITKKKSQNNKETDQVRAS